LKPEIEDFKNFKCNRPVNMVSKMDYSIKSGYSEMDFDKITDMLKDAFWCIGIKKNEVMQGAQNSALVVGAFTKENKQIGFSRVISDKTRFGYILDVIVDENCRKQGIGQAMVRFILSHPELKDVYQWLLVTKDAHGVYQKVGFNPVARPDNWMEIRFNRPMS
jgi:ribosomal protein S18 acetylase RimI-like enzyme